METEFWQKDIELMDRKDLEAFQLESRPSGITFRTAFSPHR